MAGLIARLTGRKAPKTPWDPALEGMAGARQGPGPTGEQGYPGSTSATRYFKGASPRDVELDSDTVVGFNQGFEGEQTRMIGRAYSEGHNRPRDTPEVTTPQPATIGELRRVPTEWYGGVPLRSDAVSPAQHAAGSGLNALSGSAAIAGPQGSTMDTETPRVDRQPDISGGVPGSNNVRNEYAQRYKNRPGEMHTYHSASRPDQKVKGLNTDGNAFFAPSTLVTVISRFVWNQGGVQTWSVQRQMPYTGRGDGARGAQLSGTRYYASGPPINVNGGLGDYGVARLRGDKTKRPVSFTEPSPWTAQFYDTTASVGTVDAPGTNSAAPSAIYVSPDPGRAGMNSTGR